MLNRLSIFRICVHLLCYVIHLFARLPSLLALSVCQMAYTEYLC